MERPKQKLADQMIGKTEYEKQLEKYIDYLESKAKDSGVIHSVGERLWVFDMTASFSGTNTKWVVYTNNDPDYYLKRTKGLDIQQGWNGKGKFPIREWRISNVRECNYLPEDEEVSNF